MTFLAFDASELRVRRFDGIVAVTWSLTGVRLLEQLRDGGLDLEDESFDFSSATWRPLWVMDEVPRPPHWDALQRRIGGELAERRRRVVAGELTREAYMQWRMLQLRLLASEGVATVVRPGELPPAQHDLDLMWLSEQVPTHIRDLYPPVRELGRGGAGRVYLVKQRHSEALCALKITRAGLGKQAVLNELRALERVRSQHVVSVRYYEPIGEGDDGRWLIVFEYVDGPTLEQYRRECPDRRVSDPVVLRDLLLGMARGLADLHCHGVVHRDLKPANVVLRGGVSPGVAPMPVIIDLGMSRGTGGMTLLGGTPGYQSPEQEEGERCTPASDVFVFGLLAYELVTGRRLAGARLQRLHEVCPGLPPALDELVKERCAVDEVSERLADGAALLEVLKDAFQVDAPRARREVAAPPVIPSRLSSDPVATREIEWDPEEWRREQVDERLASSPIPAPGPCVEPAQSRESSMEDVADVRRRAAMGEVWAMGQLGYLIERGIVLSKDERAAANWYRRSAVAGSATAMYNLGRCFRWGIGVAKDSSVAVEWFRRSAAAGDVDAMRLLGNSLEVGDGIAKDEAAAVSWYRRAAETGSADAMYDLGRCLTTGCGVSTDLSTAAEWFHRGAEAGNRDAAYLLARILEPKNKSLAIDWYRRAAQSGQQDAIIRLRELGVSD